MTFLCRFCGSEQVKKVKVGDQKKTGFFCQNCKRADIKASLFFGPEFL